MESKTFGLHFGAMADDIEEQIIKQGFEYDKEIVKTFDKQKVAILTLGFSRLISNSVSKKCFDKLFKRVSKHLSEKNNVKIK